MHVLSSLQNNEIVLCSNPPVCAETRAHAHIGNHCNYTDYTCECVGRCARAVSLASKLEVLAIFKDRRTLTDLSKFQIFTS